MQMKVAYEYGDVSCEFEQNVECIRWEVKDRGENQIRDGGQLELKNCRLEPASQNDPMNKNGRYANYECDIQMRK